MNLFALLIGLYSSPSYAMDPADYFCRETPGNVPISYKRPVKDCDKGSDSSSEEAVCIESAFCTYVGEDLKKTLVKNKEDKDTKFSDLTNGEKRKYLVDNVDTGDWLPSTLTCKKVSKAGKSQCPNLDECKGEISHGWWSVATYDDAKTVQYMSTKWTDSGAFPAAEEPKQEAPAK